MRENGRTRRAMRNGALDTAGGLTTSGFEPRIPQLRALISVAREGSYSRAAEYLSYTESGVYLQIQALEKSLGVRLVERRQQRLCLTPAGEVVRKYALRIVQEVEGLAREASTFRSAVPIVVGGGRSTAVHYLIPLIARYTRMQPSNPIRLHIQPARELLRAVEDGVLDIVVCGSLEPLLHDRDRRALNLRFVPWFRGALSLIQPAAIVGDLALQHVYIPEYQAYNLDAIGPAVEHEIGVPPTMTVLEEADAVKAAVVNGLGLAVLPAAAVRLEQAAGLVSVRRLRRLRRDTVLLVHRHPALLAPGTRAFLAFLCRSRHSLNVPDKIE
jgi:DNA-binding transcriptional LysR family regulator